jgi:hypothetical protein
VSAALFDPDDIMREVRAKASHSPPAKTANLLNSASNFSSLANLATRTEINHGARLATKAAVQRWINDHFTPSPPGICAHCREGTRADDPFILLFVASDRAHVHSSCHAAWRAEREAEAVAALDLKGAHDYPRH